MPNPSRNRRYVQEDKGRIGKLPEKAKSFHGRIPTAGGEVRLIRPKTQPELFPGRNIAGGIRKEMAMKVEELPRLTKLLLNVTVQGSLWAVQVVMSPESTVGELVRAAVRQYGKEGRRPLLPVAEKDGFDLHYSQFSLESLDPKEELRGLGSRNFFLRAKPMDTVTISCSNQAEKAAPQMGFPWLKFMNFFM
ncbi:uncharacterized protein LOC143881809 [Tasmannia lanceolata]|uniref:uncharacterized protein LOC143881809 n=1 Tax=Tasmannia lanceolata TaxID=3420 RepID=UPI0040636225